MDGIGPGGWDDVIVGAGSAGAVLAARLSQRPGRRVLLLEAGERPSAEQDAGPLGRATLSGANWDYSALAGTGTAVRRFPYPLGRVIGGSSAVNGAIALRGLRCDFDRWAADGNTDWAWERVLPYFAAIEADADITSDGHGTDGPIPVERVPVEEWDATATAFHAGCRKLGIPDLPDLNADGCGVGPVPSNARGGRRVSTADAYLPPDGHRPGLSVLTGVQVHRVLLSGGRATGVEVLRDGRLERVSADRVTLCAGGVNSPLILQRSGVGDASRLKPLGIDPAVDLPGVGENLSDHAVVTVWGVPTPDACREGAPWHQVMARLAAGGGDPDLGLFLAGSMANVAIPVIADVLRGRMGVAVSAMLLSPRSRGSVRLPDADPGAKPVITLRLASEPADVERLMWGTRTMWSLVRSSPLRDQLSRVLLWTDRMVDDEALLRASVTKFAAPMCHPAGTSRMGPGDDALAVVDQRCRVHTVDGLLVCDASVMPSIPSAPTNLSCVMLAERVAEWMA